MTQQIRIPPEWEGIQPNSIAVNAVTEFLKLSDEPQRIAPSVVGGVGITFIKNQRMCYIEFRNNGSIRAGFYDGTGEPEVVRVTSFSLLIEKIRGYL